ncbi:MAG: hypothetical protein E7294_05445 [Lachnospiraceae bacterium]|nr:hypothetical protein [Lachnospiraceae bacterium]
MKKVIFRISIVVNLFLAICFAGLCIKAVEALHFEYIEQETILPDTLRKYLERGNYGTVAALSQPIRGGAEVSEKDADYYKLGEYTDLLFLKEIFEKSENADTVQECENRLEKLKQELSEYQDHLDRMEKSVERSRKAGSRQEKEDMVEEQKK